MFTSWPRKRCGRKLWHAVHLISVPATLIACVHAYQLGSDRSTAVFRVLALVAVAGTLYTSTLRLSGIAKSRTA